MPKKRSNGEGALRKRQNGLWECMIMTGFQPNGKRKYKSFYARTQREVLQKVKDYQTAINSGLDVTKREPTFAEWAQTWYDGYRAQVSTTTYEGYGYTLKTLNKTFGAMPLRSIKAADVEAFLRELTADGKHQSQASKCRGMMFQIMRKAQANDLILKNPVELADKTRQKPQKSKKDSFTAEEVQKLFKYLPHDKTGDSIRLLLLTGMRSQELLALEAGHIEPDGSCIHIRQAVKQVKGTVFVGATKSATSVRDVPVPGAYRDMVKRLRTYCTPYLWTGKGGDKPCNPTHFRDKFAAAIKSVPGVRPLTPHSCRHTFVSQLQAQGVPMETIQSLAGHAEMDMTEHYLHVQSGVKTAAVESLAQLIGA